MSYFLAPETLGASGTTEATKNITLEATTSRQQVERNTSPATSKIVTMDGDIIYAPVHKKVYDEFKINLTSDAIRVIPRDSRPDVTIRDMPPPIVRLPADETSALCTIM